MQRNRELWSALKALPTNVGATARSPVGAVAETKVDPRLLAWMERSRSVLNARLERAVAKLQDPTAQPAAGVHPANMLFGILGESSTVRLKETVHTGLLAWFIDPSRPHGFGSELMRALLRLTNLAALADQPDFKIRSVSPEHTVPGGRIDIFADGTSHCGTWSLWVEAKTVSPEGAQQLSRYERSIDTWIRSASISAPETQVGAVFLTPTGRAPRTSSAVRHRRFQWTPIGYGSLALAFWRTAGEGGSASGRDLLRLYLASVLHDLAGWPRPLTGRADFSVLDTIEDFV